MRVYTIEDLETFERDEDERFICPPGDYSEIEKFNKCCVFVGQSKFGNSCCFTATCHFGNECEFGDDCSFADDSTFGNWCLFGKNCDFGIYCIFGEDCSFDEWCSFGKRCSFGECCSFGEWCSFGESCSFGEGCSLEMQHHFENISEAVNRVIKIDRIGSRKGCTYFFKTLSEIYVRCGCFFGTLDEFEKQVNETHKDNEQYRTEYLEAIKYIKAII